MIGQKGFREIDHTADWQLAVWAADITGLFEQSALGMARISGLRLQPVEGEIRNLDLQAEDLESLLISFLSELNFFIESEGLGYELMDLSIDEMRLYAQVRLAPVEKLEKEIKAVTWHQLQIVTSQSGMRVNIVFDV
jgi:SHS2 domain-containing protein